MGCPMKSTVANPILPAENFVVLLDGQSKSEHRRFVDALIAGLLLRNEFPHHKVEILETPEESDVFH